MLIWIYYDIRGLRLGNMNRVLIGNLNNLVKSKLNQFKGTMLKYMDIFIISETIFDEVFFISQFSDG